MPGFIAALRRTILLFGISISLVGCTHSKVAAPPTSAIPASSSPSLIPVARSITTPSTAGVRATPRFREVGKEAGLNYRWVIPGKRPLNILQTIGNGCAFLDYNNDGNLDILLIGPKLALYKGDGTGHFTDVTHETGLDTLHGHFLGCAVGDYDNDGFDDLYISGWRTGLLLHNEGGKTFKDVTRAMGLKPQPWGSSCGFADLKGDGYLDLYIGNYAVFRPNVDMTLCPEQGILTSCGPRDYDPLKGVLYHNEGGKRFREVTAAWGTANTHGRTLGIAFADFDRSGHVSVALANDLKPGDLLQNRGNGKLKNIGTEAGVSLDEDGETHAGMGIDWGDYDNDGLPDLFVTTFGNETKCLYHNVGYGRFTVVSKQVGIEAPALPYVAWGCKFLDADNDGWLDLLIANGHVQDNISRFEKTTTFRQPMLFLHNMGGKPVHFENATRSAGLDRLPLIVGRGLAVGDYDNDGRVDALVVDSEGRPLLLHNESLTQENGWVGFRLIGTGRSNRDGYGGVITVRAEGKRWTKECQPGGSYLSSSDPRVHFGLGTTKLESVTIRWSDGMVDTWTDLVPGRYYTAREGTHPE
jgi:hypothetical protein